MIGVAGARHELGLEQAVVADEAREDRRDILGDIESLPVLILADDEEAPGDGVGAVIDDGEPGRLIPALLVGPDEVPVIERRALDQIAADEGVEFRQDELAVVQRQRDPPRLGLDGIDQQGREGGLGFVSVMIRPPLTPLLLRQRRLRWR